MNQEKDEHDIVLQTLSSTEPDRKCYRMIGGALVETNVKTTKPILTTKRDNLNTTIENLKTELMKVATEFEKWKKDNKIQVVKQ